MADYSALMDLERKPEILTPPVKVEKMPAIKEEARKPANPQAGKPPSPQKNTPALPHKRGPTLPLRSLTDIEVREKYSLRIWPSLRTKVKIYAAQQDIDDCEVIEAALTEYFERHR